MSSSPASVQMEDVRRRSQSLLALSGSAQDVKADVQTMASIPLPLSEKYLHLGAETMLRENTASSSKQEVADMAAKVDLFSFLKSRNMPNSIINRYVMDVVKPHDDGGVTDQLYAEIKPAVDGANYIIKHMRNKNDYNEEKDNWSGIARTVDRLCLFLVTPAMTIGTIIIFLMGICNHPPHLPFKGDPHDYREENPRLL